MKIDQNVTFLKTAAWTAPLPSAKGGTAAEASKAASVASQARLTSPTPLLPSTNGDFDASRVAEIRASISAGRYQVNTSKIADGLLATVHELLNKGKP